MDRDHSRSPRAAVGSGTGDPLLDIIYQREQARLSKDFTMADTLREQLTQMGVTLFDKTNSWSSSDGRSGRIPTFSEIQMVENGQPMSQATAAAGMGAMAGMPDMGAMGGCIMPAGMGGMGGMPAGMGGMGGTPADSPIRQLVLQREQARCQKNFEQADQCRAELKAIGVEVFDKEKIWRSQDGQAGIIVGFFQSGPTDTEISTLVAGREKARQANDWATSDMIRNELQQYGIQIFDKEKQWRSTDGRSGMVPLFGGQAGQAQGGKGGPAMMGASPMMGGGGGADYAAQLMEAALQAQQNPAHAAQIMAELTQGMGGCAAPMQQMQMQGPKPQMQMQAAAQATNPEAAEAVSFINQVQAAARPLTDAEIEWLVALREKVRQGKDFPSADAIRNAMKQVGVELYEKEKAWKANDGRQGVIPMWGAFA